MLPPASIAEGNTFINCQREISFGLVERSPDDHSGGIIRNNFLYRAGSVLGDTAIGVFDSPNTQVLHNTVFVSGGYPSPIEYRFGNTTGVVVRNNLVDGAIQARDGASASVSGNVVSAPAALFVNPSQGDLHLKSTATAAIDKAGAVVASSPSDFDGEGRPQGAAADVGADEYGSSVAPRAPTNLRIVP